MPSKIRLLIVEDHVIMREGLVSLLVSQPDFEVIGEAGTVAEAISLSQELKPDLILMDYGLPDGTGLEATRAILGENPDINIVFLTVHEADDDLFAAIRYGANRLSAEEYRRREDGRCVAGDGARRGAAFTQDDQPGTDGVRPYPEPRWRRHAV
jgi:CheY-like chemotaxis protein